MNYTLFIMVIISLIILGGIRSRIFGGGIIDMPKILKKALEGLDCALLICAFSYLDQGHFLSYWEVCIPVFIISSLLSNMGHADFYQMGLGRNVIRDQTLSPVTALISKALMRDKTPVNRGSLFYDAVGMALVGLSSTIAVGLGVVYIGHVFIGIIIALSGITNALAYYIGRHLLEGSFGLVGTEWGEWLRGLFKSAIRWGCFFILWSAAL